MTTTQPLHALVERSHAVPVIERSTAEKTHHRHRWLLRACRERPRGGGAPEQGDERTPPHSTTSSARPSSGSGTVRPRALADFRLMISSILVDCWTGRSAGLSPFSTRPT